MAKVQAILKNLWRSRGRTRLLNVLMVDIESSVEILGRTIYQRKYDHFFVWALILCVYLNEESCGGIAIDLNEM